MIQVELIRQYLTNRLLPQLRSRLTVLPVVEITAWTRLSNQQFCAKLVEDILDDLGRVKPGQEPPGEKRPRGRPKKDAGGNV